MRPRKGANEVRFAASEAEWTRRGVLRALVAASGATLLGSLAACGSGENGTAAESARDAESFDAGDVQHILPSVTHERMRIKVSLGKPRARDPLLSVSGRRISGVATDLDRQFFTFDVRGLDPATEYRLQLLEANGAQITSEWPLATFPAQDADASSLRLLCITCPGGRDEFIDPRNLLRPLQRQFQPMRVKRRILARARALSPDALLVNGDHVYWDMRQTTSSLSQGRSPQARLILWTTPFRRDEPVEGNANNETAVKKAFGPQIAGLYGIDFRSIPTFFVQDDHDYGDNDEADPDRGMTFPPDAFQRDLTRFTQKLYYPELWAPPQLGTAFASYLGDGLAQSYGVLRYGRLVEGVIYDWMAHWTDYDLREDGTEPDGSPDADAKFVPSAIEAWLVDRTTDGDTVHFFHAPSTPVLWTAGKWAEPYPDVLDEDGNLTMDRKKQYWPHGWNLQHDRILSAASANRRRIPLILSGDIHSTALGVINRSNGNDYSRNPIVSVLVGTPGSNLPGFPSTFRGTRALPSLTLDAVEYVPAIEQNGFSLVDFTQSSITVSQFVWDVRTQDESEIDAMRPISARGFDRPV
jgi:hypothetical protein